ncbi:hypothetical protein WOLCODRAFT_149072 [Wolfiporia cocos MD-104 SS10]|uniref:Mid2 domain-containing protein n=1 Tax=Wolfiporia cocos (strain MD-104) TaxID=742152 RepID=A0A2H3J919_WOLCO|nr:hypothetical protein WOLCODRAFT_149072 [Wolfiporia cocos MD-104 SS10]
MCNIIRTGLGVNTNLTFILDGHPSGTYRHIANPNGPDFEYNVTVFSSQNLAESQHTLVVSTVGQGEPDGALALFDWAMYTYANDTETSSVSPGGNQLTSGSIGYPSNTVTESVPYHISTTTGEAPSSTLSDNTNSATSRSPVATLVGALVGGIAGLLALILAFLYLCRRIRGRAASPSSSAPSTTYQTTSTNAVSMGHPLQTAYAPAVRPPFSRKVLHDMRSGNMRDADPPPSAANHSTAASVTPFPETSMRSYPSTMILPRDNLRGHRGSFLQQADAVKFVAGTVPDEQNVGTVEGSTSADQSVSAFTTVHDSSDLQRRIDMLQAEMDRMRADVAPPPAYDFEEGR